MPIIYIIAIFNRMLDFLIINLINSWWQKVGISITYISNLIENCQQSILGLQLLVKITRNLKKEQDLVKMRMRPLMASLVQAVTVENVVEVTLLIPVLVQEVQTLYLLQCVRAHKFHLPL